MDEITTDPYVQPALLPIPYDDDLTIWWRIDGPIWRRNWYLAHNEYIYTVLKAWTRNGIFRKARRISIAADDLASRWEL